MSSLRTAIKLAKSGKKLEALEILRILVDNNDQDIYAWLWLAQCTPDYDEATTAIHHVLDIRPTLKQAKVLLDMLTGQRTKEDVLLPEDFPVISIWRK
jgi:hypothetical protein